MFTFLENLGARVCSPKSWFCKHTWGPLGVNFIECEKCKVVLGNRTKCQDMLFPDYLKEVRQGLKDFEEGNFVNLDDLRKEIEEGHKISKCECCREGGCIGKGPCPRCGVTNYQLMGYYGAVARWAKVLSWCVTERETEERIIKNQMKNVGQ